MSLIKELIWFYKAFLTEQSSYDSLETLWLVVVFVSGFQSIV